MNVSSGAAVLVVSENRGAELAAAGARKGFDTTIGAGVPDADELTAFEALVIDEELFAQLPLEALVDREVRVWIASEDADPWGPALPRFGAALKRAMDVLISAGVLAIFSPLLIMIAIAIRVTSKGPLMHTQDRLAVDGRRFKMHKFRTMHTVNDPTRHQQYFEQLARGEAEAINGLYKMVDDPRITRVGRVLRKYSLDELPQFLDVLRGDMSVVGPRPLLPREIPTLDGFAWQRLRVKPGITGLWQVSGRARTTFDEMIQLDVAYWRDWTLRQEINIICRTPAALMRAETA